MLYRQLFALYVGREHCGVACASLAGADAIEAELVESAARQLLYDGNEIPFRGEDGGKRLLPVEKGL